MTEHITARQFHAELEPRRVARDRRRRVHLLPPHPIVRRERPADPGDQRAAGALEGHTPDVDLRQDGVTVRLIMITGDYYGMSQRDVELARQISAAARRLGRSGDPSAVQSLRAIPGASVTAEVMPFGRALLGYEPRGDTPDEDLVDPRESRAPALPVPSARREPRQGGGAIHIADLDAARAGRSARRRCAGSRRSSGPRRVRARGWMLADAAGNEADIATTLTRHRAVLGSSATAPARSARPGAPAGRPPPTRRRRTRRRR